MTYNERVPYPVIVRAVSGDALAMEQVVERYRRYAMALATKSVVDGEGRARRMLDEDMLHQLLAGLARRVLRFVPF